MTKFERETALDENIVVFDKYGDFYYFDDIVKERDGLMVCFLHIGRNGDLYKDWEYAYKLDEVNYWIEYELVFLEG